jgi:hypothetical protein
MHGLLRVALAALATRHHAVEAQSACGPSTTCLNGGSCTHLFGQETCSCLAGFQGDTCEEAASPGGGEDAACSPLAVRCVCTDIDIMGDTQTHCQCADGWSGITCGVANGQAPAAPSTGPAVPASAVMGPWLGTDMPDSAECPIADFRAKLVAVDAACCAEPGSCSGPDAGAGACALGCAAKLLPLYSTCNRTMTQLLDDMDGVTDGVAQIVETMRGACLSVPSTSIIDEMIRMRDEDGCTIHGDGVGEEVVVTAPNGCSDTDATLCGLVDSGLLSCEDDFCPDCTNAHKCDATCTFDCAPADAGKDGKGHRRAQIHLDNACSPLNLEDKVGPVNDACWYVRRTHLAL